MIRKGQTMTITLTSQQNHIINLKLEPGTVINVIGGPQCGKTVALVSKIIHHITNDNLDPNNILILSLTNKNVENIIQIGKLMANKIHNVAINWEQLNVMTFHGLANRILLDNIGDPTNTICNNIISSEYEWELLYQLAEENCDGKNITKSTCNKNHSKQIKNKGKYLEHIVRMYQNNSNKCHFKPMEKLFLQNAINIMNDCNIMTNDDLVRKAIEILKIQQLNSHNNLKNILQYKLILIDDCQDLYPSLLPFLEQLLKLSHAQLVLFGDPNQRLYQFMGDNAVVMKQLMEIYNKEKYIALNLDQNFSNSPEIFNFAKEIFLTNPTLYLNNSIFTLNPTSHIDPQIYNFNDPLDQFEFIVQEISKIMTSGVTKFNDILILSRTNTYVNELINHLKFYGLPCEKVSSKPEWVDDLRIQFILNLFKIIEFENNPLVNCSFPVLIILSHLKGIGNRSLQTLYHYCQQNKDTDIWKYFLTTELSDWDPSIFNKSKVYNYLSCIKKHIPEKRFEVNTNEITRMINDIIIELDCPLFKYDSQKDLEDFKSKFMKMVDTLQYYELVKPDYSSLITFFLNHYLLRSIENAAKHSDKIRISTMHSAKGLNFPIVFLANPPLTNSNRDFPVDSNILYTSITRARNLLYLMNINHPGINPNRFKKVPNIGLCEPFWRYYLNDKSTTFMSTTNNQNSRYSLSKAQSNQNFIQNKFGIRFLTTMVITPKYFNFYKSLVH